jgi:hypothetical protein
MLGLDPSIHVSARPELGPFESSLGCMDPRVKPEGDSD